MQKSSRTAEQASSASFETRGLCARDGICTGHVISSESVVVRAKERHRTPRRRNASSQLASEPAAVVEQELHRIVVTTRRGSAMTTSRVLDKKQRLGPEELTYKACLASVGFGEGPSERPPSILARPALSLTSTADPLEACPIIHTCTNCLCPDEYLSVHLRLRLVCPTPCTVRQRGANILPSGMSPCKSDCDVISATSVIACGMAASDCFAYFYGSAIRAVTRWVH